MYGIHGERLLTEHVLDHLEGFEDTGPFVSATPPGSNASSTSWGRYSTQHT